MSKIFVFLFNPLYLYTILVQNDGRRQKAIEYFRRETEAFYVFIWRTTKENASLRQLLAEKEVEIAELQNSRKELEAMYTNLKTARIISINDNELRDTKQRLAKLVREVDKCIALLNE